MDIYEFRDHTYGNNAIATGNWKAHLSKKLTMKGSFYKVLESNMTFLKVLYPFLDKTQIRGRALLKMGIPSIMGEIPKLSTIVRFTSSCCTGTGSLRSQLKKLNFLPNISSIDPEEYALENTVRKQYMREYVMTSKVRRNSKLKKKTKAYNGTPKKYKKIRNSMNRQKPRKPSLNCSFVKQKKNTHISKQKCSTKKQNIVKDKNAHLDRSQLCSSNSELTLSSDNLIIESEESVTDENENPLKTGRQATNLIDRKPFKNIENHQLNRMSVQLPGAGKETKIKDHDVNIRTERNSKKGKGKTTEQNQQTPKSTKPKSKKTRKKLSLPLDGNERNEDVAAKYVETPTVELKKLLQLTRNAYIDKRQRKPPRNSLFESFSDSESDDTEHKSQTLGGISGNGRNNISKENGIVNCESGNAIQKHNSPFQNGDPNIFSQDINKIFNKMKTTTFNEMKCYGNKQKVCNRNTWYNKAPKKQFATKNPLYESDNNSDNKPSDSDSDESVIVRKTRQQFNPPVTFNSGICDDLLSSKLKTHERYVLDNESLGDTEVSVACQNLELDTDKLQEENLAQLFSTANNNNENVKDMVSEDTIPQIKCKPKMSQTISVISSQNTNNTEENLPECSPITYLQLDYMPSDSDEGDSLFSSPEDGKPDEGNTTEGGFLTELFNPLPNSHRALRSVAPGTLLEENCPTVLDF